MSLELVVTEAGRVALVNAANTGTSPVTIAQAGLSATAHVASPGDTVLPGELRRVTTIGGGATADDTIHVSIRDESTAVYDLRSFALYLADGTLFAIYGQPDPILSKTATSTALIANDVIFADIDAAELTFGATNFTDPNATTSTPGLIEIATLAEAQAAVDALRSLTPATAAAALLTWLLARDGSGSGIDADMIDGYHASELAKLTNAVFSGDVRALTFALDSYFRLSNETADIPKIAFSADDYLTYNRTTDILTMRIGSAITLEVLAAGVLRAAGNLIWHAGNDGAGSALDADLLDGLHAADFIKVSDGTRFGSNANGFWQLHANGTIEMWGKVTGAPAMEALIGKTLPASFTDPASVTFDVLPIVGNNAHSVGAVARSNTNTQLNFVLHALSAGSAASGYYWRAKGV